LLLSAVKLVAVVAAEPSYDFVLFLVLLPFLTIDIEGIFISCRLVAWNVFDLSDSYEAIYILDDPRDVNTDGVCGNDKIVPARWCLFCFLLNATFVRM